ncbi:hypothetical protein SAMN05444279_112108 [Ruegeria intermedia]|uniref:Uncharacterized protein n=1 Tax=Ruegeria intermedia TaxID=996115 RepID=A0A1M4XQT4_9RHOB|nr:hypothetical protein [Ruegeria intermedia]SHE95791.1 hypothetical protein SAMN05444279_112108 [Ruegeria intermedia]
MLYRGFSQEQLEREYAPSSMIGGDIAPYLAAYSALSAQARAQLTVQENLDYGDAPAQVLDFFPPARLAHHCMCSSTAAIGRRSASAIRR